MDFKMKIDYDENQDEYFLRFIDPDDRQKKSRYLKRVMKNNIEYVVMSIQEQDKKATESQLGMYKAFLILIEDHTGYTRAEIKEHLFDKLQISDDDIYKYGRQEFSNFIERLFQYCREEIDIEVQNIDGKLQIIKEND